MQELKQKNLTVVTLGTGELPGRARPRTVRELPLENRHLTRQLWTRKQAADRGPTEFPGPLLLYSKFRWMGKGPSLTWVLAPV